MKSTSVWITILIFNSQLLAQTEISKTYNLDTLSQILAKAQLEKDSQTIGLAARKIASVKEWMQRDTDTETLDLITLSIKCFAATGDSIKFYMIQ